MKHKRQIFEEFHHHQQQEVEDHTPENAANSPPLSVDDEDDDQINIKLPKKRRGVNKKVVTTVRIGGGNDPRSKAEIHPPKDSYSWRKYGQKPIKGSPFPRGYYRCSSSKGCPAKKQVERSCLDPNILLVTYSGDHNHSQSSTTANLHRDIHHSPVSTPTPVSPTPVLLTPNTTSSSSSSGTDVPSTHLQEETIVFVAPDLNNFSELTDWFSHMGATGTALLENSALVDHHASDHWAADVDMNIMLPIGEEDQSLFGDLGELPESNLIFRRGILEET